MIANLHIHTEFSLLESYVRIDSLLKIAKTYNYSAIAITDTDNIYGVIKFYENACKMNIKPVIGSLIKRDDEYVILLAKNIKGYYEINQLITFRNIIKEKFELEKYLNKNIKECFILTPFTNIIDKLSVSLRSSTFLELPLTYDNWSRAKILEYSMVKRVDFIPTYPIFFLMKNDYKFFELLTAIRENKNISCIKEECETKKNNYLVTMQRFKELLKYYPGASDRINRIVDQCNVDFEFNKIELPHIQFSKRRKSFRKLSQLCMRGLSRKEDKTGDAYLKRLKKELLVIHKMKLESYFLIVYKIVQFAKKENISYTGRGSAANSIVCYALEITFVDPLEHNLFFERFLHLKRDGLPDVDIDFPWNKRDKVIQFIYDTFKTTHTALISTHITFNVRSAIRETAKVFGIDDKAISCITKKIPFFFKIENLTQLSEKLPEFAGFDFKKSLWEKVLYFADKITRLPRHISIHPGGMVISRRPLFYFTSLEKAPKGFYVTQLDMYDIEKLGLLKIDILGQRSLAVVDTVLEWIKPQKVPGLDNIFNDSNTVDTIMKGKTIGCFYIESPAMRQLLKKLKVRTFEELTAASSIIRPGVAKSGMMQKYIRFHNDPSCVTYIHEDLKEFLKETYGIMIYQEDVIRVAAEIAGFKLEDGDILRKAMSGKGRSSVKMELLRNKFISGCIEGNYPESTASELWDQIESFAGYAFCKAHSASYARISFFAAYLKKYFPAEFMASVLSNRGGFYAPVVYVEEARRLNLKILSPDVRIADFNFIPWEKCSIVTGLSFIKNISYNTIERIINEREKRGFGNLTDFVSRCRITETEFVLLTKCGALDWSGYNRKQLFFLSSHLNKIKKEVDESLLFTLEDEFYIPFKCDFSFKQKMLFEIEMFGFSPSANPLELINPEKDLVRSCDMHKYTGKKIKMLGIKIFSRRIPSKKWEGYMKFISFMDQYGTFETFLSLRNYNRLVHFTNVSSAFYVYGKVSHEFNTYTLQLNNIEPVDLTF